MKIFLLLTDRTREYYSIIKTALRKPFSFLNPSKARKLGLKSSWFNEVKEQYDANKILESIKDRFEDPFLFTILADLYVSSLNFVFGKAVPYSGAILSLNRLRTEKEKLFKKRIRKEVRHEVGHIYGLKHCNSHKCVMRFSNSIEQVDRKGEEFCMSCRGKLEEFKGS